MMAPLIGALVGVVVFTAMLPSPGAIDSGSAFWSGMLASGILAAPTLTSWYLSERKRWNSYRTVDFWFETMGFFVGACCTAGVLTVLMLILALVNDTL